MHMRRGISRLLPISIAFLAVLDGCAEDPLSVEMNQAQLVAATAASQSTVVSIPQQPGAEPVPTFIGTPAIAHRIFAPAIPQNSPFGAERREQHPRRFVHERHLRDRRPARRCATGVLRVPRQGG